MKPKLRKQIDLDLEMIEIFIKGHSFESLCDWYEGSPFISEKHKHDTWKRHAKYILEHYRDRVPSKDDPHTYPSGTRPWAWWEYEHGMKPPGYGTTEYICGCRKSQLEYLKKHDLLFHGEEFQARTNAQLGNMKNQFRKEPDQKIKVY